MADKIVQVTNIYKQYRVGEVIIDALRGIDLEIEHGDFSVIQGSSGSGKSTLLHIIGCVDVPTSGRVMINGIDTVNLKSDRLAGLRLHTIGFVFQHFYLLPMLTAYENIELPMKEARVPKTKRKERVLDLLESVELSDRADHRPGQLSGGEQQRVAIARALANDPPLILADEPTGELDSITGSRILKLLAELNQEFGKTTIIVTHDENLSKKANRIIKIRDGRIVSDAR
ncbi:ABC-type antimicrobial peptide transport system, ATPase component [Candidatus Methanoperedens nitroreducens]|uniref:ABC-type antimicrobial peptide transport system, ATPase component n=1 Tax=Candidatus Methanoperedens nitratireducens TaxID=1392998 RepID=A0A062V0Z3_9EURY|nr:ABC transporter ATP-binding protein [Candidatus Methanoperedens nitroreducens]KCZ72811.1 ABC-type antimicrobial peptide transport system, ATPase component [Candidatus Methanoperedens nitroreducens]MDJ1423259.1 ABC transporter ATP-binding protein [Candidatus Methanoperedens sp.]